MKLSSFARSFLAIFLLSGLLAGVSLSDAIGQSRRQPPTSTQKKNQRPTPGQVSLADNRPLAIRRKTNVPLRRRSRDKRLMTRHLPI